MAFGKLCSSGVWTLSSLYCFTHVPKAWGHAFFLGGKYVIESSYICYNVVFSIFIFIFDFSKA